MRQMRHVMRENGYGIAAASLVELMLEDIDNETTIGGDKVEVTEGIGQRNKFHQDEAEMTVINAGDAVFLTGRVDQRLRYD